MTSHGLNGSRAPFWMKSTGFCRLTATRRAAHHLQTQPVSVLSASCLRPVPVCRHLVSMCQKRPMAADLQQLLPDFHVFWTVLPSLPSGKHTGSSAGPSPGVSCFRFFFFAWYSLSVFNAAEYLRFRSCAFDVRSRDVSLLRVLVWK